MASRRVVYVLSGTVQLRHRCRVCPQCLNHALQNVADPTGSDKLATFDSRNGCDITGKSPGVNRGREILKRIGPQPSGFSCGGRRSSQELQPPVQHGRPQ